MCKICYKNLKTSGNTTNLRGHLENLHSQQLQDLEVPCKKQKRKSNITDFIATTQPDDNDNKVDLPSTSNSNINTNPSITSSNMKAIDLPQNAVTSTSSDIVVGSLKKNT